MGWFSNTFRLMGASWEVLKQDKELLLFSALSGLCCLLVLAAFALPLIFSDITLPTEEEVTTRDQVIFYGILFLFYFCSYFVVVFFNAAIISSAVIRFAGGNPTLGDGFRGAMARLPYIFGWALVAATVGLVLRIIENSNKNAGRFVAGILGMVWTLLTFLAVPVLVVEKKGPIDAIKESSRLLKKTWGQQILGNFSFGFIFGLLAIPGVILVIAGFAMLETGGALAVAVIALGVVYWIVLGVVQSALMTIFQAALYLYARDQTAPAGFTSDMLSGAVATA